MFLDGRSTAKNAVIDADVCVVGSGPAGITIARQFLGSSTSVVMLESGGLSPDADAQGLCAGTIEGNVLSSRGKDYLSVSRARYFGGSSNLWAGWTRPLDPLDFERRDWIPASGWPFKRGELESYYGRAAAILAVHPFAPAASARPEREDDPLPFPPLRLGTGGKIVTQLLHVSDPPVRFGQVYRADFSQSENVRVYLHSTVRKIVAHPSGGKIERLEVRTFAGNSFVVRAKIFVLACGAIENARLLLASRDEHPRGLGDRRGLVGRYFMEHAAITAATLFLHEDRQLVEGYTAQRFNPQLNCPTLPLLCLSEETQIRERLPNLSFALSQFNPSAADDPAFKALAKFRKLSAFENPVRRDDFVRTDLVMRAEQLPNPDSRLILEKDAQDFFGVPRPRLIWNMTDEDRRFHRRAHQLLADEIGGALQGRLRMWEEADTWFQSHPMGTTRMSDDPRHGVVNANGQVHGVPNLLVAGSSVFPTSGFSNPTLTIVALALRMADFVKEKRAEIAS